MVKHIPVLKAIRAKCMDCTCNQPSEIRECTITSCALHPFRMGKNPYRQGKKANPTWLHRNPQNTEEREFI